VKEMHYIGLVLVQNSPEVLSGKVIVVTEFNDRGLARHWRERMMKTIDVNALKIIFIKTLIVP